MVAEVGMAATRMHGVSTMTLAATSKTITTQRGEEVDQVAQLITPTMEVMSLLMLIWILEPRFMH